MKSCGSAAEMKAGGMARDSSRRRRLRIGLTVAFAVAAAPVEAMAAEPRDKTNETAAPGPTAAEFAKLQREVAEQRQLIIQMLQIEQQRYDMLLRLLTSGAQVPPGVTLPTVPSLPPAGAPAAEGGAASKPGGVSTAAAGIGTVTGHLQAREGALRDAYVYLDQPAHGAGGHGHTVEIRQKDKQFSPQVSVVQRGTTVVFPNFDPVFHNVFSPSGKNSFDLGSYRSGDQARSVVLTSAGVVEVFCNIHSRMSATILVVPSPLYAKAGPDGTFKLENVPSGTRRIVAWSPGAKPVTQKVDVTPSGAQANFTLVYDPASAHVNKLGQPYGSYKE
jgi:plastocyanin